MGGKPSKSSPPPPPPPPPTCNVIDAAKGITDYAWVDSTNRNGGTATAGGTMLCLKKCRPGDTPYLGPDKKPTGMLVYSERVVRTNGGANANAGDTYSPYTYPACSKPPCATFNVLAGSGCIP